ncbi:hypothetical protein BH10ACT9_BH10ACT9_03080 [soil metagenome]
MTTPETNDPGSPDQDSLEHEVPPANPAYSTPPPEGLPDAEND